MKRYWLFAFSTYYPVGGLDDRILTTDDLELAVRNAAGKENDGYHIQLLDTHTWLTLRSMDGCASWLKKMQEKEVT